MVMAPHSHGVMVLEARTVLRLQPRAFEHHVQADRHDRIRPMATRPFLTNRRAPLDHALVSWTITTNHADEPPAAALVLAG
jgi:hypothetical protein